MFFIMQKLKPEIWAAIIKAAEAVFYKEGFKQATTRKIADSVGISVSNLYLYFKNKAQLFNEIVTPFYNTFNDGMAKFIDHKDDKDNVDQRIHQIVGLFKKIITKDKKRFVILFAKSNGTQFEKYKTKVIALIAAHIYHEIKSDLEKELINIIAGNLFNSIIEIAKISKSETDINNNVESLFTYHMKGIEYFI